VPIVQQDLDDNVTIQDGDGSGDRVKVGNDKRLWVDANITSGSVGSNSAEYPSVVYGSIPCTDSSGDFEQDVDGDPNNVDFSAGPPAGEVWYVTEAVFILIDKGSMDPEDYGSIGGGLDEDKSTQFIARINSTEYLLADMTDNLSIIAFFSMGRSGSPTIDNGKGGFLDEEDVYSGTKRFPIPLKLVGDNGDKLTFRIRADLKSIDWQRGGFQYYKVLS
jgi:hypothetical protein